MEETRPRWRDLCSQPLTANRYHLSRVGAWLRRALRRPGGRDGDHVPTS